jgi:phosphoribosylcarboxyaminoimidazole (NCAIR) mutase
MMTTHLPVIGIRITSHNISTLNSLLNATGTLASLYRPNTFAIE